MAQSGDTRGNVIGLGKVRKARARAAAKAQAEANARAHGRSSAEKAAERAAADKIARALDGVRRVPGRARDPGAPDPEHDPDAGPER